MIIRKANPEDFEGYTNLEQEFFNYHKKFNTIIQDLEPKKRNLKKEFKDLLKKGNFFYVGEDKNKLIGYAHGYIKKLKQVNYDKLGYLETMIITKKYRNKGIASKFMNKFLAWLKTKNIKCCEISVNVKNKSAIKIYEKGGFEPQFTRFVKRIR